MLQRRGDVNSLAPKDLRELVSALSLSAAGVYVTEQTAMQVSAVIACVRVLSESVASLPLFLYERVGEDGKERATGHPVYRMLHDAPNPLMTAMEFWEAMMMHLTLHGNAFAEIEVDSGGRARNLWLLNPRAMTVMPSDGRIRYLYDMPAKAKLGQVEIPPEFVLHVRALATDGIIGLSPLRAARNAIGLSIAAEQFGSRFFANDARPSVVLKHPGVLSDEAAKRLRESWMERYGGADRSWRPAVLEEGMDVETLSVPPEDAQFLATRKFQLEEIARIYRVPPHMIGDLDRATFNNIEQMSLEFVTYTLRPWLVRIEQAISARVLLEQEREKYFAEFLVDGLLRGDAQSRFQAYATGKQWGWLSTNDIRRAENMPPIPGGDEYWQPVNMVVVGTPISAEPGKRHAHMAGLQERKARAARRRELMHTFEQVLHDAASRVLRREINDVRNNAKKLLSQRQAQSWEEWLEEFYRSMPDVIRRFMGPAFRAYAEAIAMEALAEVDQPPDAVGRSDVDWFADQFLETYVKEHVISSKGQLQAVVRQAVENGDDPLEAVNQRLDEWDQKRANKVADKERVEMNGAVSQHVWAMVGVTRTQWATFDESCPYCRKLDGRTVDISHWFASPGDDLGEGDDHLIVSHKLRHPPAHQGCDCMVVPVLF